MTGKSKSRIGNANAGRTGSTRRGGAKSNKPSASLRRTGPRREAPRPVEEPYGFGQPMDPCGPESPDSLESGGGRSG
jgi:hypothetical protein